MHTSKVLKVAFLILIIGSKDIFGSNSNTGKVPTWFQFDPIFPNTEQSPLFATITFTASEENPNFSCSTK